MRQHLLNAFGSIFLIVALIGFATLFGNYQQYSPSRAAPQISTSMAKPFANDMISNQVPFLKLLNKYPNPPEYDDPEIANKILEGRAYLNPVNETGRSLPDDFVFVSGCRPGYRC